MNINGFRWILSIFVIFSDFSYFHGEVGVRKNTLRKFGVILSIGTADYTYLFSFLTPTMPLVARGGLRELAADHSKLEFPIVDLHVR